MSIRSGLVIAIATVGILGAGWSSSAAAQGAGCTGGGKMSKQIARPMSAAQDALRARKWQEVLNKTREAESVPGAKSQFDQYWMSEFRGYAYHELHQDGESAREFESSLGNPCMPEAKKLDRYKTLVGMYSALRNYPKVIDYSNRALKVSRDPDIQVALAQAYYQSNDNKSAVRVMNELLNQSNRVPKEQQLLLIQAACNRAGDNVCVSKAFEQLVIHYPKTEYWQNLMSSLRQLDTDDIQKLNVMRLSVYVNVMKRPDEYKEMAQLALEQKLSGEAQTVLEQGFAKKVFTDQRSMDVNTRLLNAAKKEAVVDKAALAKSEADARAAASGDADVKVGAQYLAFGDAAKAAEILQRGITKSGIGKGDPKEAQLADEASLLLGIAHLRKNDKIEAAKAFRSVKRDPTMVRIAKLWLLNT